MWPKLKTIHDHISLFVRFKFNLHVFMINTYWVIHTQCRHQAAQPCNHYILETHTSRLTPRFRDRQSSRHGTPPLALALSLQRKLWLSSLQQSPYPPLRLRISFFIPVCILVPILPVKPSLRPFPHLSTTALPISTTLPRCPPPPRRHPRGPLLLCLLPRTGWQVPPLRLVEWRVAVLGPTHHR